MFKGERNRRFAYLGYMANESAEKARKELNNTFIGTSKIKIEYCFPDKNQ